MSPVTCTMICIPITQSSTPASAPTTFFSTLCTTLGFMSSSAASVSPTVTNPSTIISTPTKLISTGTSTTVTSTQSSETSSLHAVSSTLTTESSTPITGSSSSTTESSSPTTETSTQTTESSSSTTQTIQSSTLTTKSSTPSTESSSPTTPSTTSVTTAQTTVRPTTTKRPEKNPCQNGGIWDDDDDECDCPDPYEGTYCERIDDEIEVDEVEASVDVTLRITNQNFSAELENESSPEYKNFSKDFANQMDIIYSTVEGYKGVKITKIRQGSIIVDHEVLLAMSTSEGFSEEVLNKTVENIQASLKNSSSAGGNNGFVFDNSSITVKKPALKDNCTALVPGKASKYYKLVFTEKKAVCVSICDSARNDSMKCGNGMCGMTNNGPLCYCDVSRDYWYFGVHCDYAIHKNGLIAGLSVTLIVLVLGLLAITIYNMKFRRTIKQFESKGDELKKEIMDKWDDDEWEWSNPGTDIVIEESTENLDGSIVEEESCTSSESYLTSIPTGELKIRRPKMNMDNFYDDV
ncbi:mucin-17-like [Hemitrygon akajei]|uniref:mucin-17-like n=1 Tax=Hemitrygon akajei TaxID=2704970 RepID=UPI003BF9A8AB